MGARGGDPLRVSGLVAGLCFRPHRESAPGVFDDRRTRKYTTYKSSSFSDVSWKEVRRENRCENARGAPDPPEMIYHCPVRSTCGYFLSHKTHEE